MMMWYWSFMLICVLLIPLTMIITGRMMRKHCPKKINGIYGYRTKRSRINDDTWKFAHAYFGKLSWKAGIFTLIPTIIVFIPIMRCSKNIISSVSLILCLMQSVVMIVLIVMTEDALKKTFTKEGIRK